MKRLFVGGLSQAISQADLQNQFSKFGAVSDVEIITRKDEQGNPQKIFAYINISISEADLKKCVSVLNKTKWKGGTLQIQQAKESFLHRLAQEREAAKAKEENSRMGNADFCKKMGTIDLNMKAVPGTEVPGHKNWVVSKFGRILPVLHLKNQRKRKIIKYDPSKYCHNLKKIGENSVNAIPITNLTWHLEERNDPMSRKRRGDFADFHSSPKKLIKEEHDTDSAESEGDETYNAIMKNCLHVGLTLADLEQMCCSDTGPPRESTDRDPQLTTSDQFVRDSKRLKTSNTPCRGKPCAQAEKTEENKNSHSEQKSKENKFQAFRGIGSLYGKESMKKLLKESISNCFNKDQYFLKLEDPSSIAMEKGSLYADSSLRQLTPYQHAKKANNINHTEPQNRQSSFESQDHKVVTPSKDFDKDGHLATPEIEVDLEERTDSHRFTSDKSPNTSSWEDRLSCVLSKKAQKCKSDFPHSMSNSDVAENRHAQDNQKRLEALDARQKAKETQKKLVHHALANLGDHSEVKRTHTYFSSDSESETKETSTQKQRFTGEELVKEPVYKTSEKLFGTSDDEESDSEDDSNRFKIKPQFEGRSGQKLMGLQSHFGTDDRFRMDSRFLESDSEEEQTEVNEKETAQEDDCAAEKKKALRLVQLVLRSKLSSSTRKESVTAKKFKDIIHYDPTKHDHATFERKIEDKPKESKTKRKIKRMEGEKLPEVSKTMYYHIAKDLKERLQTSEDISERKENISWNEDCGGDETEVNDGLTFLKNGDEKPSGFTFSFFDSDAKNMKEDTYRVEIMKPPKIAWQEDPYYQDSSSEEEDTTEEADHRKPSVGEVSIPKENTRRFFFFCKNDERLHASDLFWRGAESIMSGNSWEARTNDLHRDCRKKHKDAKRKVKPK
ncbi:nucleolar protein 8 [Tenrec ecaudatus]|uniref:nucleolar protein 8 n=1 Tax=Tenrec ecaudatus TaxID=94439 RepID=UPI003F5A2F0A